MFRRLNRLFSRSVAAHVLVGSGIAMVAHGAGLIYSPAAWVAAGLGLSIYGYLLGAE